MIWNFIDSEYVQCLKKIFLNYIEQDKPEFKYKSTCKS